MQGGGPLDGWVDFPVGVRPRPLVLVDGYVHVQAGGFIDGAAKLAFFHGAIDSAVDLPDAVTELPSGAARRYDGARLCVRAVRRTRAPFMTDRGPRRLPAYELDIDGAAEPVLVLDPATEVWWPARPTAHPPASGAPARIDGDDVTLHVPAHGGVLTEFLRCEFSETDAAVLAHPVTIQKAVAPGTVIHSLGITTQVTGRLTRPLGDRVLVDEQGSPILVLAG